MHLKLEVFFSLLLLTVIYCMCVLTSPEHSATDRDVDNITSPMKTKSEEDEQEDTADIVTLRTHSVNASLLEDMHNMTTKDKQSDEEKKNEKDVNNMITKDRKSDEEKENEKEQEKEKEYVMKRKRAAHAKLTSHLKNLSVARERTIPLIANNRSVPLMSLTEEMYVLSVIAVNDIRQTMTTALLVHIRWMDEALAWNKSRYESIETVEIPPESIWTPNIILVNSLTLTNLLKETKTLIVTSDGSVVAKIPLLPETYCHMDLSLYPFDRQSCTVKMHSMTDVYNWTLVSKEFDKNFTDSFALTSEWELLDVFTKMYEKDESLYPEMVVTLKRRTLFYSVCLMLPMAMTSYINTLVFLLPLQSGEKISFLLTLYVSISVHISFFSNMMPRGLNNFPISMKLLIGVMAESLLVLLATILVLRLFQAEQEASDTHHSRRIATKPHAEQSCSTNRPASRSTKHNDIESIPNHLTHQPPQEGMPKRFRTRQKQWFSSRVHSLEEPMVDSSGHSFPEDGGHLDGGDGHGGGHRVRSSQLNRFFFAVFFVGNTIFHLLLYVTSVELI